MTPDKSASNSFPAKNFLLPQSILWMYLLLASEGIASASSEVDETSLSVEPLSGWGMEPPSDRGILPVLARSRYSATGVQGRRKRSSSLALAGSDPGNTTICPENHFECLDGNCRPRGFLCDGVPDCPDGSDEKSCSGCRPSEFRCGDGECIPRNKTCDGHYDCYYGSDERQNCCKKNEFQCLDGACIPGLKRCDGSAQCSDMSDEYNCKPLSNNLTSGSYGITPIHHPWIFTLFLLLAALLTPPCF